MDSIYEKCKESSNIVIYGAGAIANLFFLSLVNQGLDDKVLCFTVTEMLNNEKTKYGKRVVEYCQLSSWADVLIVIATQKINHPYIEKYITERKCKNYVLVDEEKLIRDYYGKLYEKTIEARTILFMNLGGRGYGGNPKYIAEEFRKRNIEFSENQKVHLIWAVSDEREENGIPEDIEVVEIGSQRYYEKLATSQVWVDNVRKSGDVRKRNGQIYVQAWHGAAPIKKVEKDVEDKLPLFYVVNAKRDSYMADLFLSGSAFYTELYKKSFWYDGEIMKVGLPRQDVFWNTDIAKKKVYDYYHLKNDDKLILYAPTFRSDYSNGAYDLDIDGVLRALRKRFGGKYVCAVSKHPDNIEIQYQLVHASNIIQVEKYPDFEELLAAADILISDYSGCVYDFSFTERPIFLYQKDIELYMTDRNFYIPLEKMPYIRATSNQELQEQIMTFDYERYKENLRQFMDGMKNYDDGNASRKVVDRILELMEKR